MFKRAKNPEANISEDAVVGQVIDSTVNRISGIQSTARHKMLQKMQWLARS